MDNFTTGFHTENQENILNANNNFIYNIISWNSQLSICLLLLGFGFESHVVYRVYKGGGGGAILQYVTTRLGVNSARNLQTGNRQPRVVGLSASQRKQQVDTDDNRHH
jgi:hypothetical protein